MRLLLLYVLAAIAFAHCDSLLASERDALAAYQAGNYQEALRLARRYAEQGDAGAQNLLGAMYLDGEGTPKNIRLALDWFQRAAEQGHAVANLNLGLLYVEGKDVPTDPVRAVPHLNRASTAGLVAADYVLAQFHENGTAGLRKSLLRAEAHYLAAANGGIKQAFPRLAGVYRNIGELRYKPASLDEQPVGERTALEAKIPSAWPSAATWYRRAAALGDESAATQYVSLFEYDRQADAIEFLRRLGNANNDAALLALAKLAPGDPEKVRWLSQSAERGNPFALAQLGVRYLDGRGVPQSTAKAVEALERASEEGGRASIGMIGGDAGKAASRVADMYATGQGAKKDLVEAVRWYRIAGNLGGETDELVRKIAVIERSLDSGMSTGPAAIPASEEHQWFANRTLAIRQPSDADREAQRARQLGLSAAHVWAFPWFTDMEGGPTYRVLIGPFANAANAAQAAEEANRRTGDAYRPQFLTGFYQTDRNDEELFFAVAGNHGSLELASAQVRLMKQLGFNGYVGGNFSDSGFVWRSILGGFRVKGNAEKSVAKLKAAGLGSAYVQVMNWPVLERMEEARVAVQRRTMAGPSRSSTGDYQFRYQRWKSCVASSGGATYSSSQIGASYLKCGDAPTP